MTRHDLQCNKCQKIYEDMPVFCQNTRCGHCGGTLEVYWHARSQNARALGPEETTVVYEDPATGKVAYPGRNDQPMPARYEKRGYVRKELTSLRLVDQFSKAHGVVNERAHYDRNGRGKEDE